MGFGRLIVSAGAAACALCAALVPAAARADSTTCGYDGGSHTATITVTPGTARATGAFFRVDGKLFVTSLEGPPSGLCGAATNTNTDTIVVNNASATQRADGIFYVQVPEPGVTGPNGPGFTNEPGNSDEIEWIFNYGPGGRLGVSPLVSTIDPGSAVDLTLGGNQINLNAGEADGVDADVTLNGVTGALFYGSDHSDRWIGSGGTGTPATPFTVPMQVYAVLNFDVDPDTDAIVTGSGDDLVSSGPRADFIATGAGKDTVSAGSGDDQIFGGPGKDLLQGLAGLDLIKGGNQNDRLLGGPDPDRLNGGAGKKDRCSKSKQDHRKKCEILVGG
jgi:Ca2+-binding RTX toxin-like protein